MARKNITVDDKEVIGTFKRLGSNAKKSGFQATEIAAWTLLEKANHLVPHVDGNLEKSGDVEAITDGHMTFYNAPYAAYQHEGMRADGSRQITSYSNGRQGKYLESPLREREQEFMNILAEDFLENANQ